MRRVQEGEAGRGQALGRPAFVEHDGQPHGLEHDEARLGGARMETQLERDLARELGAAGLASMRDGLLSLVTSTGDLEHVLARRARLVW